MGTPTLGGGQWWTDLRYAAGYRIQRHARTGKLRLLDAADRRIAEGERCFAQLPSWNPPAHIVVLLHGLARRRQSLLPLARALESAGHHAVALDYASTRQPIAQHAAAVLDAIEHLPACVERVSFVTHSLGGIVARHVLAKAWSARQPHRLVMLAPPSTSARFATQLDSLPFRWVMGPSGEELAAGSTAPTPTIPFSIVAGGLRGGLGMNPLLEGDDDGVVALAETRLEGAHEHHRVNALHTNIMNHPEARAHVLRFLEG